MEKIFDLNVKDIFKDAHLWELWLMKIGILFSVGIPLGIVICTYILTILYTVCLVLLMTLFILVFMCIIILLSPFICLFFKCSKDEKLKHLKNGLSS